MIKMSFLYTCCIEHLTSWKHLNAHTETIRWIWIWTMTGPESASRVTNLWLLGVRKMSWLEDVVGKVGWLVGWLVGGSVGRSVGRSVGWLVGCVWPLLRVFFGHKIYLYLKLTASLPLNMDSWKTTFVLWRLVFRDEMLVSGRVWKITRWGNLETPNLTCFLGTLKIQPIIWNISDQDR